MFIAPPLTPPGMTMNGEAAAYRGEERKAQVVVGRRWWVG
jgi:hypothetical protein